MLRKHLDRTCLCVRDICGSHKYAIHGRRVQAQPQPSATLACSFWEHNLNAIHVQDTENDVLHDSGTELV